MNFLEAMDRFINHGESVYVGNYPDNCKRYSVNKNCVSSYYEFDFSDMQNGVWRTIEKVEDSNKYLLLKSDIELLAERMKRIEKQLRIVLTSFISGCINKAEKNNEK